jgi:4-diphosphocytidyl-2-C-methyl-D-erythritol kinase
MENHDDSYYREVIKLGSDTYSACALAKLNINLKIGKKESSGFHKLSSIMQTISLHDRITLTKVDKGEEGILGYYVKDNIIAKAIDELSRKAGERLYCRISVPKTIPVAAGLGGGSADAAAVLRIANTAFGLHMDTEELEEIAREIGNDVSFLLYGGRALVEGGKKHSIKEMDTPKLYYVIARPKMKLSTKEMYALHDKTGKDFTELASELCPDTRKALNQIRGENTVESGVTGKGPTVFGAYKKYNECESVADQLSWLDGDVFIERSVDKFV